MGINRILTLYKGLPPESRVRTAEINALTDGQWSEALENRDERIFGPWSHEAHLLAQVCDRLDSLIYISTVANVADDKKKSVKQSPPIPRPGINAKVKPAVLRELSDDEKAILYGPSDEAAFEVVAETLGEDGFFKPVQ